MMEKKQNPMRRVRVEKLVINMGCGTKLPIETAKGLHERITGLKGVVTKSHTRSTFNIPKGKPLGFKITIRADKDTFLRRFLQARSNTLPESCFDRTGNVSFGVKEYIDVPGVEYDPKIGNLGFDVCVTLERPGYRVKRKRIANKVGGTHRLTAEDAKEFMRKEYGVKIEVKEQVG